MTPQLESPKPTSGLPRIPVAAPALVGREKEYVLDCLESNWISSNGSYIDRFEREFAQFCDVKHAIACCNGTVAVHLALLAMDLAPGDEVIVPTLTYVASVNPVVYCGAKPVFVDCEPATWNIDPGKIEEKITDRTKGIIAVHLYGHPTDMDPILELAKKHNLFVIEDAAEAHGATYKNKIVGSIGDIGTFSFYGNKIITTGEGGMVVTDNDRFAQKMRLFRGQGQNPAKRYWFDVVGYNYRMTNIAAAIGLAQLEQIDWHLSRRREVAAKYRELLGSHPLIQLSPEEPWAKSAYWINCAVIDPNIPMTRDEIMKRLDEAGIETRPFFYPVHQLPMYEEISAGTYPVAQQIAENGINLPSAATLTDEDIFRICRALSEIIDHD